MQNELLRQGLNVILNQVPRVDVVSNCDSPAKAQQLLASDVSIVITTLAERTWLALPSTPDREPGPKVLVLMNEAELTNINAFHLPMVDGVLFQNELSVEALDDALYRMTIGQTPLPNRLVHQLIARAADGVASQPMRSLTLTPRENETLALLASGMSNKQIARALGVSSHGAKRLVGSIMIKLGAPNRTAAVVNAIKAGIIDSP